MSRQDPEEWSAKDSEIECARCGAAFYYELTRCPNCGRAVYEPEEDDEEAIETVWGVDPDHDVLEAWMLTLLPAAAIFAGLFVSFLVSGGLFIAIRGLFGGFVLDFPGRGLLLASVPAGAAVGGYLAAALEKERPRAIGWWVGGLSIISALVLAGVDRNLSSGDWAALDMLPLWLVTVLAGAAGGEAWRRQQRETVLGQLFPDLPAEDALYEELLAKTGHDVARAERLIEFERRYMPNATRRTLIEAAIERWHRDNR